MQLGAAARRSHPELLIDYDMTQYWETREEVAREYAGIEAERGLHNQRVLLAR